jgi:signal transduction histidine kinase
LIAAPVARARTVTIRNVDANVPGGEQPADTAATHLAPSLRTVLEAVGSIAADLDLDVTLQRIVDAAAGLSGARYGALGVLDDATDDRRLLEFVTHGLSQDERERIGPLPTGHGILGVLIDHPEPLRIDNLGNHALSNGFPANHPPMTTFLGAPIRIGSRVFGNLYLTERHGGGPFTDQDTELVTALAALAGVLIENARLYARLTRRRRWLEAAAAVSTTLLGPAVAGRPADVIAEYARAAGDADGAALLLPIAGRPELRVAGGAGLPIDPTAVGSPDPLAVLHQGVSVSPLPTGDLLVRVGATERIAGVLWLRWLPDRLDRVHSTIVESAEGFAEQAALVLEVALAQDDRARLAVFEDRDRIGRDLHDLVIQRLFAVGLMLENTSRLAGDGRVADRISTAVDQLDETIKDIRRTIFELANPQRAADLRDAIEATITGIMPSLGFRPKVHTIGPVHSGVSDDVRPHLLAVLREALSNVGRHAQASAVTVTLEVDDEVVLTVLDDGRGIAGLVPGNGLPNMRARAADLGGSCELSPGPGGGTRLVWRVPAQAVATR